MALAHKDKGIFLGNALLALVTTSGLFIVNSTRNTLKGDDLAEFDQILLTKGQKGITYVDNLRDFTNPTVALRKFLFKGELSPFIDFTAEEKLLPAQIAALKARFEESFDVLDMPTPAGFEYFLQACNGNHNRAEAAMKWLESGARHWLREMGGDNGPALLRFQRTGGTDAKPYGRIQFSRGGYMKKSVAEHVFKAARDYWNGKSQRTSFYSDARENRSWDSSYQVVIRDDKVSVGCKEIPRAEVERIAAEMGWA